MRFRAGTSRAAASRRERAVGRGSRKPERVQDLLSEFLEREGVGKDVALASAVEEWGGKVGPKIAAVARARSVMDGTLVVEVRSSAWLMELNMMKGEILRRVNQDRDVAVEKLVFVMSPEG
jgi:predicted nucleic acid-binding Zn ribbon protein